MRSKYGSIRTNGYASKLEADRGAELDLLSKAGKIENLRKQVRFPLVVNGHLIATYVADFVYSEGDALIVEDTKGIVTPIFNMKNRLMEAVHGISVRLLGRDDVGRFR